MCCHSLLRISQRRVTELLYVKFLVGRGPLPKHRMEIWNGMRIGERNTTAIFCTLKCTSHRTHNRHALTSRTREGSRPEAHTYHVQGLPAAKKPPASPPCTRHIRPRFRARLLHESTRSPRTGIWVGISPNALSAPALSTREAGTLRRRGEHGTGRACKRGCGASVAACEEEAGGTSGERGGVATRRQPGAMAWR